MWSVWVSAICSLLHSTYEPLLKLIYYYLFFLPIMQLRLRSRLADCNAAAGFAATDPSTASLAAPALKHKLVKSCDKVFWKWLGFVLFVFSHLHFIMPRHNHLLLTGMGGGTSERLINLPRVDHLSALCFASYIANVKFRCPNYRAFYTWVLQEYLSIE